MPAYQLLMERRGHGIDRLFVCGSEALFVERVGEALLGGEVLVTLSVVDG